MDRRDYLKPSRFGNIEKRRLLDIKNLKEKRSYRRTTNFNQHRDIEEIAQEVKENKITKIVNAKKDPVLDRKLELQKFKAEREAQKKFLKEKKKPPFVVGIPHHGSSPVLKNQITENSKRETKVIAPQKVRSDRVTRATTKNTLGNVLKEKTKSNEQPRNLHLFKAPPTVKIFPFKDNKTGFSFNPQKICMSAKKLTSPHTPTVLKRSAQKAPLKNVSNSTFKLIKSQKNLQSDEADEVLAAPLLISEDINDAKRQEEPTVGGTHVAEEIIEIPETTGTEVPRNNPEPANEVASLQLKTKTRSNAKQSEQHTTEQGLVTLLVKKEEEDQEEAGVGGTEKTRETPGNVSSHSTYAVDVLKVEEIEDEVISKKCYDIELARKVEFQQSRLQSETTRLQEMADRWESLVLHESLPQEVVDEVDSVVGQTRLLTSDKFQQFRRLIIQFENKTGTHPITWDDLNGFWDMVYLQVESLDKKYTALDSLKNNNWENPEPVIKKKRRPAKKLKANQVTEVKLTSPGKQKQQNLLQLPEDSVEIKTPTTDMKQVRSNVLLKMKRTRNSSSPYIAMRLSGVGRASNIMGQPDDVDGSPRSIFVNSAEPHGTPKSALKKSLTALSASTKKRTNLLSTITLSEEKIEETDNTKGSASKSARRYKKSLRFSPSENQQKSDSTTMPATEDILVPAFTPRRSMRLLTKLQPTPVRCIHCDSPSCDMPSCSNESRSSSKNHSVSPADILQNTEFASFTIPDGTKGSASKSTRRYKKSFAFSPSENHKKSDSTTVPDINKPSTSGVRFSLRPSILTFTENNNFNDIPKKTKKRRQASVFTPSDTTTEIDTAGPRRSTRQSRKVTFETGAEEKPSLKLPATPYKKFQLDS